MATWLRNSLRPLCWLLWATMPLACASIATAEALKPWSGGATPPLELADLDGAAQL